MHHQPHISSDQEMGSIVKARRSNKNIRAPYEVPLKPLPLLNSSTVDQYKTARVSKPESLRGKILLADGRIHFEEESLQKFKLYAVQYGLSRGGNVFTLDNVRVDYLDEMEYPQQKLVATLWLHVNDSCESISLGV